jgi:heptosyltransferase-2
MKLNAKQIYLTLRSVLLFPFLISRTIKKPQGKDIKKILLLRYDRIGDMVVSTGAFKALKKAYPAACIIVLASGTNKEVIENNPDIDEILVYKGLRWFLKEIRKRKIDLAIDFFYTYELKSAFLTYISGAKYRLGFENAGRQVFFNMKGPGMNRACTMIEHLGELVSNLGIGKEGYEPQVYLSQGEVSWAKNYLVSNGIGESVFKVAMHPGAFYPSQRWPADGFAGIGKKVIEKYHAYIILFGDTKEEKLVKTIQQKIGAGNVCAWYDLNLRQIIALLSQCDMLLCNNSGLLHIACALKIPTVSTMGPTDPVLWWPYGKDNIVIRQDLPCSPCSRGVCAAPGCMELITPRQIEEALDVQMEKISKKYNRL